MAHFNLDRLGRASPSHPAIMWSTARVRRVYQQLRKAGDGGAVRLTPIVPMTLEQAIVQIEDDELVEVTPQSIRIREKLLPHDRKRASRTETV